MPTIGNLVHFKLPDSSWALSAGLTLLILLCSLSLLQGCAAPLAAIGASSSAAASSAGTTVATAAAANPVTASSVASSVATGKSPLEHAASAATKKECSFLNALDSKPICVEITFPPVNDFSTPLAGPADKAAEPTKH
ncbi:hypothetical protein [Polynucleobacter necessarius]|uniref:hypothetical protein n=1 Tax=Polynucleobacter necessarius TaxID=576610 RepID=UPI000E096A39|nr:hypothetical protein [Polynucleobacter necessarius]